MKTLFIAAVIAGLSITASAQELTVKDVAAQPDDMTAKENPVVDINGDTCALVKIKIGLEGLQFNNRNQYVGTVTYADGIYYVYKSPNMTRMLSYQHESYLPGQFDMADYGIRRLKKGRTYLVQMEAPPQGTDRCFVVLRVVPVTATVTFDGKTAPVSSDGIYEFPAAAGTYNYVCEASDYLPQQGAVTVGKGERKTQVLRLQPIVHTVEVKSNRSDAHVYIDNVDYGRVGKISMPQGRHLVRVQCEGYLDEEQTVDVNADIRTLTFNLKKNENVIDIHATDVTIYSTASKVYKNNKELKGWESGKPLKFMPGKYMISDDSGNSQVITVGTKPMKVTL